MTFSKPSLSKNKLRRMHGWAKAVYPNGWYARCSLATEYLVELDDDAAEQLMAQGWPAVFRAAEQARPDAFTASPG